MRTVRRSSALLGLAIAAVNAVGLAAGRLGGPGGTEAVLHRVINGKAGNTTTPITIKMACFGAIRPGETGHPMAGQTLAVH